MRLVGYLTFIFLASTNTSAQEVSNVSNKWRISSIQLFFGPGIVTENGSQTLVNKTVRRAGYTVGGGVSISPSDRYVLSINFQYENKGLNEYFKGESPEGIFDTPPVEDGPLVPTDIDYKNKKTYNTISIDALYKFGKHRQFGLGAGPYGSELLTSTGDSKIIQNGRVVVSGISNQKALQMKFDFGLSLTARYDFKIRKIQLFTCLRSNLGIYNVAARVTGAKEHTEAYYFLLGLRLPRKRAS